MESANTTQQFCIINVNVFDYINCSFSFSSWQQILSVVDTILSSLFGFKECERLTVTQYFNIVWPHMADDNNRLNLWWLEY